MSERTEARQRTAAAIERYAAAQRVLGQVRSDRTADPELISDAAQAYRLAETEVWDAVQNETAAIHKEEGEQ